MSYQTYTTKALVCGTKARNTADCSYLLFAEEAGMLFAEAKSARAEKSRQRYALQDFSLVRVSLVKGRYTWKVGSIEPIKNYYHQAVDQRARGSVVSIFRLLRRFVRGEEVNHSLFDYLVRALEQLSLDTNERNFVDVAVQLRILGFLGYVDKKKINQELYECSPEMLPKHFNQETKLAIEQLYSHAVSHSHL